MEVASSYHCMIIPSLTYRAYVTLYGSIEWFQCCRAFFRDPIVNRSVRKKTESSERDGV